MSTRERRERTPATRTRRARLPDRSRLRHLHVGLDRLAQRGGDRAPQRRVVAALDSREVRRRRARRRAGRNVDLVSTFPSSRSSGRCRWGGKLILVDTSARPRRLRSPARGDARQHRAKHHADAARRPGAAGLGAHRQPRRRAAARGTRRRALRVPACAPRARPLRPHRDDDVLDLRRARAASSVRRSAGRSPTRGSTCSMPRAIPFRRG